MELFCGIGVYQPKHQHNTCLLFRTAAAMNLANFTFTIGERYNSLAHDDTIDSAKCLPCWNATSIKDFLGTMPRHCELVMVELSDDAVPLEEFAHPKRAVYMLGGEELGIPREELYRAKHVVKLPSPRGVSINLASCGSIVLWDRFIKQ